MDAALSGSVIGTNVIDRVSGMLWVEDTWMGRLPNRGWGCSWNHSLRMDAVGGCAAVLQWVAIPSNHSPRAPL